MQQKNDETSAVAMVLGFAGAIMIAFMFVIFALLAFFAFVLTILSIFAWNNPIRLGKFVIEPEEARAFVIRGAIGAVLVPAFLLFVSVFFGIPIVWDYLPYMVMAGYVGGSIGLEILFAQNQEQNVVTPQQPQQVIPAPPQRSLPPSPSAPFRFATWDDEERGQ